MASFTPRLTAPNFEKTNKSNAYYIKEGYTSPLGESGVNACRLGNGSSYSVLPNCVGYAWGRAFEIMDEINGTLGQYEKRPTLSTDNAERWYGEKAEGYERSQVPRVGSIMCWRKGDIGNDPDVDGDEPDPGHVAVVEKIENGMIITSESNWSSGYFKVRDNIPLNGNYNIFGEPFVFQGFIYLPGDYSTGDTEQPDVSDDDYVETMAMAAFDLTIDNTLTLSKLFKNDAFNDKAIFIYKYVSPLISAVGPKNAKSFLELSQLKLKEGELIIIYAPESIIDAVKRIFEGNWEE